MQSAMTSAAACRTARKRRESLLEDLSHRCRLYLHRLGHHRLDGDGGFDIHLGIDLCSSSMAELPDLHLGH